MAKKRKRAPVMGKRPVDPTGLLICPDVRGDLKHPIYGWRVYRRPMHKPEQYPDWVNLKVIRVVPTATAGASRASGNYWLGWNTAEKRFGRSVDYIRMPADLREYIEMWMSDEQFGYSSLDDAEFTTLLAMADRLDQAMS